MTRLSVRVPATTSNLGPGFDSLGLALELCNHVKAEPADEPSIEIEGEGADTLSCSQDNLMFRAFVRGCREVGIATPTLRIRCRHAIPPARGLGSSAAAVIAGLMLADGWTHGVMGPARVFALATELEGHPDNTAPAVFGALQSSVVADGVVHRVTVPVKSMPMIALFIPGFEMKTREARAVLPATLSRDDAVYNISRTALLVAALASGETGALDVATRDVLHQPARTKLFPAMPVLFAAARKAGAYGVWLSGAGSTLAAFAAEATARNVAEAMASAARAQGITGRAVVTRAAKLGALWTRRG